MFVESVRVQKIVPAGHPVILRILAPAPIGYVYSAPIGYAYSAVLVERGLENPFSLYSFTNVDSNESRKRSSSIDTVPLFTSDDKQLLTLTNQENEARPSTQSPCLRVTTSKRTREERRAVTDPIGPQLGRAGSHGDLRPWARLGAWDVSKLVVPP
jgi:hypothetical protein